METYSYGKLGAQEDAIRLVRIERCDNDYVHCSIHNTVITHSDYIALSYVWGTLPPTHCIHINGQIFLVRPNLWSFFAQNAPHLLGQDLWIDALCINQDDDDEKSRQVPLMGQVFSSASKVVGWLHSEVAYSRLIARERLNAFEMTLQAIIHGADTQEMTTPDRYSLMGSVLRLIAHEYWERLWIVQEIQLAQQFEIFWEGHRVTLFQVMELLRWLSSHHEDFNEPYCDTFRVITHKAGLSPIINLPIFALDISDHAYTSVAPSCTREKTSQSLLIDLVTRFSRQKCCLEQDRVYALLAMADPGSRIAVNYKDTMQDILLRMIFATNLEDEELELRITPDLLQRLGVTTDEHSFDIIWEMTGAALQSVCPNCNNILSSELKMREARIMLIGGPRPGRYFLLIYHIFTWWYLYTLRQSPPNYGTTGHPSLIHGSDIMGLEQPRYVLSRFFTALLAQDEKTVSLKPFNAPNMADSYKSLKITCEMNVFSLLVFEHRSNVPKDHRDNCLQHYRSQAGEVTFDGLPKPPLDTKLSVPHILRLDAFTEPSIAADTFLILNTPEKVTWSWMAQFVHRWRRQENVPSHGTVSAGFVDRDVT